MTSRFVIITFAALTASVISAGAVGLTLSPSATSNTYSGVLTVQITGLTNGEPVLVEKYLDSNGNGVIDLAEPLIDSFTIRDGGVSVIGGVTNLNVPFDSNPASGAITTTLSLAAAIEMVVAKHMFRFVSPYGNFTPQTNSFTVTNAAFAQSVSGTVSVGLAPVPYAIVVVLSQPNFNFVTAVFADGSGHYSVKLAPGSYGLMPVLPNYYTDQSHAGMVTLASGQTATADLFLTNGSPSYTISGQVADATNGAPLAGVFMQFESGDLFAIAFTDANGNYSAALSPSFWRVKLESNRLARRAYVTAQTQVDATAGSVAGVSLPLPKANALFYGRITDNASVPFGNIDFHAQDSVQQFKSDGYSDASGNYAVAVLASGGSWSDSPSTSENPTLYNYIVNSFGDTAISAGQAIRQDFIATRATAQISGRLQDNAGNAVAGIGIGGNATIAGTLFNIYSTTDSSGNYAMPAAAGNWSLWVNCCGNEGLDSRGLFDPFNHNVPVPPTNAVLNITVYPTGTPFLTQPMRFSPTQFGFNLNGSPGSNYTVKASTDLVNWTNLFSVNLSSNSMFLQDTQATAIRKFYKVQKN